MTDTPPRFVPYVPGPTSTPPLVPYVVPRPVRPLPPPPQAGRAGLIAVVVLSALILMLGTGFGVWFFMSPSATAPAATLDVSGVVVLNRGQFVWTTETGSPTCEGLDGFDDIRPGTQVTVTDAGGKVLAVGALDQGVAEGIDTLEGGMQRATTCSLPFKVSGIPSGVGPYGVEVAHRGVLRYNEGATTTLRLGF